MGGSGPSMEVSVNPRRLGALLGITLALLCPAAAVAHAELVSASPGPDDVVEGSPEVLTARFDQNLNASRTSLEVLDSAGARVVRGGEPGANRREFRIALPQLAPGRYQVRWTSFSSEDGELGRGTYTFQVITAPTPSPTPEPTPSRTPAPSSTSSSPPSPSPSATPSPTITRSPEPTGTGAGGQPPNALDASVLLPIVVVLTGVGLVATRLLRRRGP